MKKDKHLKLLIKLNLKTQMKKVKEFYAKNKNTTIALIIIIIIVGAYGTYRLVHHAEVLRVKKAQEDQITQQKKAEQKAAKKAADAAAQNQIAPTTPTMTPTKQVAPTTTPAKTTTPAMKTDF